MALIGEPIPQYVQNQIQVRQASYGSGSLPGFPRTEEILLHQNSNNAFIKMASGVSISAEKLSGSMNSLGFGAFEVEALQGMGLAKNYVLFGGTAQMGTSPSGEGVLQQKTNFLGNQGAYEATSNFGIVPMPGIESLEVKSLNRGSLKKATVKLTAQTRDQLAILDVLYMRLGYTVLIEWGNSIYMASSERGTKDGKIEEGRLQQMYTSIIENNSLFFNASWEKGKSYLDLTEQIAKARKNYDGNFDALLGKVSNFNWTFNPDGSYSIELTVISLGDVVESLKTNIAASYETLAYVDKNDLTWATEGESIDRYRKDNIILSMLHVFRLQNQSPKGDPIYIGTQKPNDTSTFERSKLGNLLEEGPPIVVTRDHFITETARVGFKYDEKWIEKSELVDGYYDRYGTKLTKTEVENYVANFTTLYPGAAPGSVGSKLEDYEGLGWNVQNKSLTPFYTGIGAVIFGPLSPVGVFADVATIVFSKKAGAASYIYTETNSSSFDETSWQNYLSVSESNRFTPGNPVENNPVMLFRKDFLSRYAPSLFTLNGVTPFAGDPGFSPKYFVQELFRTYNNGFVNSLETPASPKDLKFFAGVARKETSGAASSFKNPLTGTGYEKQDAFVIKLDKPQYYIRFGYLLSLLKQKVITRIKVNDKAYADYPNLFDINTSNNQKMLCLPLQISFDWRTCIVRRGNFTRESWDQNILKELAEWTDGSNTANTMNVYLNFNFLADSMSSNMDERGNVSVYDFIKAICDGINKAMAGVNNLEPVIDEDTNTLSIFESSPIPKDSPDPGYHLQLYGYGNGVTSPAGNSTFVRKVDLKTAITPEYATMITVGATANGYVKGVEATAFARWNEGLTDRFKSELVAADKDTNDDTKGTREDTINSFFQAMSWNAKCFGIEGGGNLWDMFPDK
jgi:hypothetical protein